MLWVKAFHIIAVITWFAGIFYLPRLYVYHAAAADTASRERFKIMERKLYRGIMWPSMVVVIVLGTWLISFNPDYYLNSGWMHVKLTLVALLVGYHLYCGKLNQMFNNDQNHRSHVWYRWFNELPVIILIAVVILVVVRPF
ncbi:protoporphyrinogen oxidase HemJ [Candidatus Thalassolituus haligoni]|uniref:protoporphyrinogen oxidase HemJ n=1 Tax=Candidatus Thalassolituus haligoni TaxID=3100113 RepID=UPI003512F983|tara:strand:- start:4856 stop:5278 length:423 start_codon:yes stop_codon:yes gene_type:complete